jgi:hypothetical protein
VYEHLGKYRKQRVQLEKACMKVNSCVSRAFDCKEIIFQFSSVNDEQNQSLLGLFIECL